MTMPKLKTKKTALKRIKISKRGKLVKKQINTSHLKKKWSTNKRHRKNRTDKILNIGQRKIFKKLLGKASKGVK